MLKHATVIISLALAGLYSLGLTFHQGYLKGLGIEETQFPLTADRVFFQGLISAMDMGGVGLTYLFLSAAGIVLITEIGVAVGTWIYKTDIYRRLKGFIESNSTGENATNSFGNFSAKAFAYTSLALFLYLLLLATLLSSESAGGEYAKIFKTNASKGLLDKKSIKIKGSDKPPLQGYSIICNSAQCAYFIEGTSEVFNNIDIIKVVNLGKSP